MISRLPFSQRIIIAFVLMTVVVSGAFSLSIVAVVHFVENHLVSQALQHELSTVLHEDLKAGRSPRLDSRTQFYASTSAEHPVPKRFAELPEGLTEIENEHEAIYVYVLDINDVQYMLVQEQQEFEDREEVLFNVVLAGFLLCIAGAWGLGWLMSRHVMAPVIRLAGQVNHHDQLDPQTPPLAPEYMDDEIGHLAAAFDSTLGRLRLSLERERLFTSDVSHELRTPLMIISTSCELLVETELQTSQREQIERIGRATREMSDLVQTFLMLARANPEEAAYRGTATLTEVAREQREFWDAAIRAKGLDFELTEEASEPTFHNMTLLRTVMTNRLRNALHYTAEGNVRIVLEKDGFRIEDTGLGICADEHDLIFQPFVRGSRARGEGLGLGLSLVKRICTHQGWSIAVSSLTPRGSCFSVKFNSEQ